MLRDVVVMPEATNEEVRVWVRCDTRFRVNTPVYARILLLPSVWESGDIVAPPMTQLGTEQRLAMLTDDGRTYLGHIAADHGEQTNTAIGFLVSVRTDDANHFEVVRGPFSVIVPEEDVIDGGV